MENGTCKLQGILVHQGSPLMDEWLAEPVCYVCGDFDANLMLALRRPV